MKIGSDKPDKNYCFLQICMKILNFSFLPGFIMHIRI